MRTEREFINGFEAWKETYFEMTDCIVWTLNHSGSIGKVTYEDHGREGLWSLASELTDEFEILHQQDFEEGWITLDYFEAIDEFFRAKSDEHFRLIHNLK